MVRRGHRPPAEQVLTFFGDRLLDEPSHFLALARIARQEDVAYTVAARRRQPDAEGVCDLSQKPVGRLNQDPGAVPGVGFAAARAAVLQVDKHLEPALDNGVRTLSLDIDDEADPACVVLEAGIVQALGLRRCGSEGRSDHRMRPCAQSN